MNGWYLSISCSFDVKVDQFCSRCYGGSPHYCPFFDSINKVIIFIEGISFKINLRANINARNFLVVVAKDKHNILLCDFMFRGLYYEIHICQIFLKISWEWFLKNIFLNRKILKNFKNNFFKNKKIENFLKNLKNQENKIFLKNFPKKS